MSSDSERTLSEGTRCLAGPGGVRWQPATIRRASEDGTYAIEFDEKEMIFAPLWHGVTRSELSLDDELLWPGVFSNLTSGKPVLAAADFAAALSRTGIDLSEEAAAKFWNDGCQRVFAGEPNAKVAELNQQQAYQLFLRAGISAKELLERMTPDSGIRYYKLYWNQTRMSGRDPHDVPRPVTLDDAIVAMGATGAVNPKRQSFFAHFEKESGVNLPENLKSLLCRRGIEKMVKNCHPNNPELVPLDRKQWRLHGDNDPASNRERALVIMTPHQGDFVWLAVFKDNDQDAQVCLADDDELGSPASWALTAPSLAMFFWDLAQTGLCWFQTTKFRGGKRVRKTDIGLAPSALSGWLDWFRSL